MRLDKSEIIEVIKDLRMYRQEVDELTAEDINILNSLVFCFTEDDDDYLNYINYKDKEERLNYLLDLYINLESKTLVREYLSNFKDKYILKIKKLYEKEENYFLKIKNIQKLSLIDNELMDYIVEYENFKRLKTLKININDSSEELEVLKKVILKLIIDPFNGKSEIELIKGNINVLNSILKGNEYARSYNKITKLYLEDILKHTIYDILKKHISFVLKHGIDEFKIEKDGYALRCILKRIENVENEILVEFSDISELKRSEETNRKIAYFDTLTGLANRELLYEEIQKSIFDCLNSSKDKMIGILFIDVDDFKIINDTYGHDAGDGVLKYLAETFEDSVRGGDVVGRYAGDEFMILCKNVREKKDLERIVNRIIDSVTKNKYFFHGKTINVSLSIGVAVCPEHSGEIDDLINCADLAMYKAKNSGKNRYKFYEPSMKLEEIKKEELKNDLKNAINRGELYIEYMLQYDSLKNKYIGMESLMRWNHPEKGRISPLEFLGVAEDSGMIVEMGYWALDQSLKHLKKLRDLGHCDLVLGVNFTDLQFRQNNIHEKIEELILLNGLKNEHLMIEISEKTSMLGAVDRTEKTLKELRNKGIKLCIDDFGTGYSSFRYLNKYPLTSIKIDKEFVHSIKSEDLEDENNKLIHTLIVVSNQLGVEVLAEGIENQLQYDVLKKLGCNKFQGYYIGYPMSFEEIYNLMDGSNN